MATTIDEVLEMVHRTGPDLVGEFESCSDGGGGPVCDEAS
jgi:hypothetical protein